jgi:hypothetical protein
LIAGHVLLRQHRRRRNSPSRRHSGDLVQFARITEAQAVGIVGAFVSLMQMAMLVCFS